MLAYHLAPGIVEEEYLELRRARAADYDAFREGLEGPQQTASLTLPPSDFQCLSLGKLWVLSNAEGLESSRHESMGL